MQQMLLHSCENHYYMALRWSATCGSKAACSSVRAVCKQLQAADWQSSASAPHWQSLHVAKGSSGFVVLSFINTNPPCTLPWSLCLPIA